MADAKNFIKEALKLAERGRGLVSPNPMVGAIVANGRRILGRGWHKAFGMPHAEIEALKEAGKKTYGATLFVNLEPCCHYGKTPPCTKAIIEAGIKKVVCSMKDPNPQVNGKGLEELKKNRVSVYTGLMTEEAEQLNASYIIYVTKKRPYVILKWAQTLDGKTATHNGDSKWITGEETRNFVKRLRFGVDGILVGVNTLLSDNPALDYLIPSFQTRQELAEKKRYHKIIIDPSLKTRPSGRLWENKKSKVILIVSENISEEKLSYFSAVENCEFIKIRSNGNGRFSSKAIAENLYKKGLGSILVEGGSKTLTSFWEEQLADEIMIFTGPKILGGDSSLPSIGGAERERFSQSVPIKSILYKKMGDDFMIGGKPCFRE